jgi:phospholipid/cholesterol/gamma-HCH transport system substrate-binding protein
MTTPAKPKKPKKLRIPLNTTAGVAFLVVFALVTGSMYWQFRGNFTPKTQLTMLASRAGLVMDRGSKVTYNGVGIGRVTQIEEVTENGEPAAKITLNVNPKYIRLIPANVKADIQATTVFGNKYVLLTSPAYPVAARISPRDVIDARSVTTEFNTLFETVTSITEKVDPVKVNLTLSAAAEALSGLGAKFGESIDNGNNILADLNPKMPQIRYDARRLADLADVYTRASPDLWDALKNLFVTTAHTVNRQQTDLDAALMASIGFGNTLNDILGRGGPYLVRGAADLVPTSQLLDTYSPELHCLIRNAHDLAPPVAKLVGGNGYSLLGQVTLTGAPNPYVYPDNLPRVNARGGPGGAPGCWQPITHDLWPAPYLVMDTGANVAPYNHWEIAQPIFTEYVWGRQWGENTINP